MNILRIAVFLLIDLILFVLAYATGMYKSLFFTSIFSSIASLPVFPSLRSLLILAIMSIPILLIMLLINKKWLKQPFKPVVTSHFILVLFIWGMLELLI